MSVSLSVLLSAAYIATEEIMSEQIPVVTLSLSRFDQLTQLKLSSGLGRTVKTLEPS